MQPSLTEEELRLALAANHAANMEMNDVITARMKPRLGPEAQALMNAGETTSPDALRMRAIVIEAMQAGAAKRLAAGGDTETIFRMSDLTSRMTEIVEFLARAVVAEGDIIKDRGTDVRTEAEILALVPDPAVWMAELNASPETVEDARGLNRALALAVHERFNGNASDVRATVSSILPGFVTMGLIVKRMASKGLSPWQWIDATRAIAAERGASLVDVLRDRELNKEVVRRVYTPERIRDLFRNNLLWMLSEDGQRELIAPQFAYHGVGHSPKKRAEAAAFMDEYIKEKVLPYLAEIREAIAIEVERMIHDVWPN